MGLSSLSAATAIPTNSAVRATAAVDNTARAASVATSTHTAAASTVRFAPIQPSHPQAVAAPSRHVVPPSSSSVRSAPSPHSVNPGGTLAVRVADSTPPAPAMPDQTAVFAAAQTTGGARVRRQLLHHRSAKDFIAPDQQRNNVSERRGNMAYVVGHGAFV